MTTEIFFKGTSIVRTLLFINMHLLHIRKDLSDQSHTVCQQWKSLRLRLVLLFAHLTESCDNLSISIGTKSLLQTKDDFGQPAFLSKFDNDTCDNPIDTTVLLIFSESGTLIEQRLRAVLLSLDYLANVAQNIGSS